jgi:Tol biopolymer transport system component/tetratricopeptide (TPR) repeat protein
MKRIVYALFALLVTGCASTAYRDIPFDYSQVLTKEFRFGTGRSIPLTFERSVNVSGCITADGKYFVYASNKERNNFDIYLRALNNIKTVRLTIHPARDFAPDVSPDGKWCAFVSTRDDPEGDIFIMKLDPEKIITQGDQEVPSNNITAVRDPLSGAITPVRDASPCFSPDGKLIAFSSTRDGEESIYIIGRDGKDIRKITEGMQPRFSNNGKELIFVKKTTTGSGVFTINIDTGKVTQITSGQYVELSPCFGKTSNDIYFMRIQYDSNGDGILDSNDKGMLFAYDVQKKEEYPLTLIEEPSATPRWVPYADGVIVYSIVEGQYINIAMIPHTGIIPKQKNALRQYELALKYKEDFDDIDRYQRCLFATYYFFKESSDIDSQILIARALYELSSIQKYSFVTNILADLSKRSRPAQIYMRYRSVKDKEKLKYLEQVVKELLAQNEEKSAPFFMEELADQYARLQMKEKARVLYNEIIARYQNYTRLMYVRYKAGELLYKEFSIPEEWVTVLQSSYTYLKNAITVLILEQTKKITSKVRYDYAKTSAEKYNVPIIKAIMNYVAATALMELSQNDDAIPLLKQGLQHTKKLDVAYFLMNVTLGKLYYAKQSDEWVVYYEAAVNNYQAQWKQDIRPIIEQLAEYFENTGQRLSAEGNFKDAVALYKRSITMNTLLHLKRRYKDIYSENAPGAHIGYINAMMAVSQDATVNTIEKEYLERLPIARMDFDKAHIYGLGYIYVKKAKALAPSPDAMDGKSSHEFEMLLGLFTNALQHIDWSLFIDDTFVDAYLLKGWIYQYVDELRVHFPSKKRLIDSYFPEYLWEKSIPLYEKALEVNNENLFPQKEADIHCNIGNIYFLLKNFNLASRHYAEAIKYTKTFSTLKEEALFYYHYGYCLWQQGNYNGAYLSMQQAFTIYKAIAQKNESAFADTLYMLYRYFALFERMQGNYQKAIEWYKETLEHCAQFQCGDSQSRVYIEIAECYRRLEQDTQALVYLELAKRSLPQKTSAQYKIGWKFAGFGPVYFYDLGQDTVVIGEGKIVSPLSGWEMEILIQNMRADIYAKSGRFGDAAAQYLDLVKVTQKQKTSLMADAHITALYNAAYCYARMGDVQKALELYDAALSIAQDSNVAIGKIYQAMVQWTYCYISSLQKAKVQNLDTAIRRIEQYKKDIYDKVYNTLLDDYTKKIKAQKKKPVSEEITALKQQASKQVEAYSIKFDALIALLYMHKASILQQDIPSDIGTEYYVPTHEIIGYYSDALRLYSQAINYYGNDAFHQEFVIKLLINRGICKIHSGQFRDGYDDIISARFKANKIQSKELVWFAEATLWDLAYTYKEVKQLIDNPDRLIDGVLSRVELLPPLYTMKKDFIQRLYDTYTDDLIQKKKYKEAYAVQQRRQIITIAFNGLSIPNFYKKSDNTIYKKFLRTCFAIQDLEQKLTSAIVNEEESSVIEKLTSAISSQYKNLAGYRLAASTFLLPYLGVYTSKSSEYPVVHFYTFNNKLYGWVNKNTIDWVLISDTLQPERLTEDVNTFVQTLDGKLYVILNDTFIKLHNYMSNTVLYTMGCVPFASRVDDIERLVWLPADVVATDKKLSGSIKATTDIQNSEYIVDTDNPDIAITPSYCFANKLECSAVFKSIANMKTDELMLLADSSIYSHVASVILYSGNTVETLVTAVINNDAGLINSLKTKTVVLGKVPDTINDREQNALIVAQKKQKEYTQALERGEYDTAMVALERWKRAGLKQQEYYDKKILVLVYQNNIEGALKVMQSHSSAFTGSFAVYVYLLKGDVSSAEKLLKDPQLGNTFDYTIYEAIINGYKHKEKLPLIKGVPKSTDSILPANQLLLLYAQEAFLLGEKEKSQHIMKLYQADYIPSQRELLIAYNLGYSKASYSNTVAYRMLKAIAGDSNSSNVINTMNDYNNLLLFGILEMIKNRPLMSDEEWKRIMLIAKKGNHAVIDVQFITAKISEILQDVIPARVLQYIETVSSDREKIVSPIAALYAINAYLKTDNFKNAYTACKSLKQLPYTLEQIWYTYYIYSAIMLGKTDEAQDLLNNSQIVTRDTVLYNLFNVSIQMQKVVALKTADSNVLQTIAQNIDHLISSLHDESVRWYYFEYKYLLDKLINYAISYAMSRGNQRDALRYAELHKMIEGIALFDENTSYKSIYNDLVRNKFPITEIQKNIPRKTAVVYTTKNENDIFAWIITRTYIQPVRLQNSYKQLYDIIQSYYNDIGLLQQVFDREAAINGIMKPIIKELSGYTTIIVIPDAYTESIPYEIIQYNKDDTAIVFMPSLMGSMDEWLSVPPMAYIDVNNTKKDLMVSALKQSDISYSSDAIAKGIMITDRQISYNTVKKGLMINDNMIQPGNVFINIANTSQVSYYYCLFMIHKEMGISVLLNSAVSDVNSIIFIREFCNTIKTDSFLHAYMSAYQYLKKDKRFKNPAYWLGIRFYSRTIKGIYDGVNR